MNQNETQTKNVKRRNWILISIAIVILVAAITGGTIFIIKTRNIEPAPTEFTLSGSYKMYIRENEFTNDDNNVKYLDFVNDNVKIYAGTSVDPIVNTTFELDLSPSVNTLKIQGVGEYQVLNINTENFISIFDKATDVEYAIVKCNDKLISDFSGIIGEWKGVYKDKEINNEKIVIESSTIKLYASVDATEPYRTFDLSITTSGVLVFANATYEIALLTDNSAVLVELGGAGKIAGSVFEIKK